MVRPLIGFGGDGCLFVTTPFFRSSRDPSTSWRACDRAIWPRTLAFGTLPAILMTNEWPIRDDSNSMLCANQSCERLRWRPWPCTQCSGGLSPVGHLIHRIDAGAEVSAATPEEVAAGQVSSLLQFTSRCAHPGLIEILLPKIAEGSEHLVFLDAEPGKVVKSPGPGFTARHTTW